MKRRFNLYALVLLLVTSGAFAAEFRSDPEVRVAANETVEDDLYATGSTVVVEGTVNGDLVVAARTVSVRGTVTGDVIVAAQSVEITGTVGDDVRASGAIIELGSGAQLGDDLIAAGYSLTIAQGSTVGGDLNFGGGQLRLAGSVEGDARVSSAGLELIGSVGGDLSARVDAAPTDGAQRAAPPVPFAGDLPPLQPGVRFGDNARVGGDVSLETPGSPAISEAQVGGELEVTMIATTGGLEPLWSGLRRYAALVLIGLVLLWVRPKILERGVEGSSHPITSLGWGLLAVIAVPVGAVLLIVLAALLAFLLGLVTLNNLAGALMVFAITVAIAALTLFALTAVYLSQVAVGYAGGQLMFGKEGNRVLALLIGTLIVVALTLIPTAGSLLALLVAVFGLGIVLQRSGASTSTAKAS
ncbi:MAG: polymer-forming cytoskeletal protein [Trueperaceae bacterium]|nr:polymer-forming cytoskeletal protein [Trueperaceae bacterium]